VGADGIHLPTYEKFKKKTKREIPWDPEQYLRQIIIQKEASKTMTQMTPAGQVQH
jgi:hypothetical protein